MGQTYMYSYFKAISKDEIIAMYRGSRYASISHSSIKISRWIFSLLEESNGSVVNKGPWRTASEYCFASISFNVHQEYGVPKKMVFLENRFALFVKKTATIHQTKEPIC